MAFEDVAVERRGPVGWITFNRPEKLNALRAQTFTELAAALDEFETDDAVRSVVLTGAGDRSFSTGIDLVGDGRPGGTEEWDRITLNNANTISRVWYFEKPVITAVNGYAIAAGCNLALVSDMTLAADTASLGEPEIRHGALSPLLLLPWLTNFKAMNELYMTGDTISAERARELGLVNDVVPAAELQDAAQRLAERIAAAPMFTLTTLKRSIRMLYDIQGFRAQQSAHRYADTLMLDSSGVAERERLFAIYRDEGLKAFLEARDAPYRD